MINRKNKTYSIGEAARLCGVTEKQIRHWEDMNYIPQASRVICGKRSYRQFTEDEFRLIRSIKRSLDDGFTLAAAVRKAAGKTSEGREGEDNGR
ncbi:MAG: MerR family transcriptional regulator [Desulfobacteraceae bacterium]|nr:MAG: MerR family transcriptional regulator [Desulfobacteraceae bacterium]